MFGCNQFTALFLLVATASIALSYTHQGVSRQFPQDNDYYVVTPSSSHVKTTTTTSSYKSFHKNVTSVASNKTTTKAPHTHSPSEFARSFMGGGGGGGGGGWGMMSGGYGGGGGGGGWGGMSGGGGGGMGGGIFMEIIQLIGALIILGLLMMLISMLFGSSSTSSSSSGTSSGSGSGTTIIIIGNTSGRRRRALEDLNDTMDGDEVPQVMTRMEKYLTSWDGDREEGKKKVEPFKLY